MRIEIGNTLTDMPNFQAFKTLIPQLDELSIIQNCSEKVEIGTHSIFFKFSNVPLFFESINQISEIMGKYFTLHLIDKNTIIFKLNEVLEN